MKLSLRSSKVLGLVAVTAVVQLIFVHYLPEGLYPDLALVLSVYIGWYSDPVKGALSGSLFGLVQDATQLSPFLGLNGLSKTLAGFAAGRMSQRFVLESFAGRAVLLSALSVANDLVVAGLLVFLRDTAGLTTGPVILKAISTGLLGASIFLLLDSLRIRPKDFTRLE